MDSSDFPSDLPLEAQPLKLVKTNTDINTWQQSEAYFDLLGFINGISTAIQGKRISDHIYISETMAKLLDVFAKLNAFVDETPPIDQPQRFGNKAYRTWSRKMNINIFNMIKDALPQDKCQYFGELGSYIAECFGNAVRIDYGTGHELSFLFFMCALFKAEILMEEDNVACALRLFIEYINFVRRLQTTYRMEPAGSQGVWSLDDYQFVPFIWGSAQLSAKSPFDPVKFLDEEVIKEYKDEYLFIGCIDYICKVKTGHFAEHSPQLWSISAVPTWSKINSGLVKMYQKEILAKFPIIQHVLFGQLMPFKRIVPGSMIPPAHLGTMQPPSKPASKSASKQSSEGSSIGEPKPSGVLPQTEFQPNSDESLGLN